MTKLRRICIGACAGLLLLAAHSCVDDTDFELDKLSDKVNWTPNWIVPVGHGTYNIWDLVNPYEADPSDASIQLVGDMIHIKYKEDNIFSYDVDKVLNFPSQPSKTFPITFPGTIVGLPAAPEPGTELTFTGDDLFSMNVQGSSVTPILKEVQLSTVLNFSITNPLSEEIELTVILPEATLAGSTPATTTITVPANGSVNRSWDLTDLTINFTSPSVDNQIKIKYEGKIAANGNPINGSGTLDIDYNFGAINFQLATGDFGKQIIDIGSGELDMDVDFWDDITGDYTFSDPRVNMTFHNTVGVPLEINANLTGYNTDGVSQALNPTAPLNPDYPKAEAEIDAGVTSTDSYHKDNSSIVELMALPPNDRITYEGSVSLNPGADPVDMATPNIVKSGTSISVDMEIDIPMNLVATNLELRDTINDIDISDSEKIKFGKLVIVTKNGLPLDVAIDKVYLTDAMYQKLDSVYDATIFSAAKVNAQGEVDPALITEQSHEIEFSEKVLAKLDQTKNLIIKASVSTATDASNNKVPVKLRNTDQIEFKLAIQVKADLNN